MSCCCCFDTFLFTYLNTKLFLVFGFVYSIIQNISLYLFLLCRISRLSSPITVTKGKRYGTEMARPDTYPVTAGNTLACALAWCCHDNTWHHYDNAWRHVILEPTKLWPLCIKLAWFNASRTVMKQSLIGRAFNLKVKNRRFRFHLAELAFS